MIFISVSAQIGFANEALSLEDNKFVGIVWEPKGLVTYEKLNGDGTYGLLISLKSDDTYYDVLEGYKVSIEFTDETRQVLSVTMSETSYDNMVVQNTITDIYMRRILIYPDFKDLTTKTIKRFVIQRSNGKILIIDTKPKRAKKLLNEFKKAMSEACSSYNNKVSNDDYFTD